MSNKVAVVLALGVGAVLTDGDAAGDADDGAGFGDSDDGLAYGQPLDV